MRNIIIVLFLVMTTISNAQDFEGTLTYFADIMVNKELSDRGITKNELKTSMVSEGIWADTIQVTYKGGFYKELNLSDERSWMIYRPGNNKIYSFREGEASDMCIVIDPSIDPEYIMTEEAPIVTLLDTLIIYKEYELQMVKIMWNSSAIYYLFDKNHFKTNPENFKGHTFDGFYDFLKLSQSLPIIIIKEAGLTIQMSLIDFTEKIIDDSLFKIPDLIEEEDFSEYYFGAGKMMKIKE